MNEGVPYHASVRAQTHALSHFHLAEMREKIVKSLTFLKGHRMNGIVLCDELAGDTDISLKQMVPEILYKLLEKNCQNRDWL